jgi:hypothetical protein
MKQQHHPTDLKTYQKGINSDTNKEILGSADGEHADAKNMRSVPMDGDNAAKKKIKGEELLYPNIDNRCIGGTGQPLSESYECMMTQEINGNIVEIWASPFKEQGEDSLIRVNGKIVCMSPDFPVDVDHPLQYDKNESCVGGEFYITDHNVKPMVFSLKDLMLNSGLSVGNDSGECTQKYFDLFNIEQYTVGVKSTLYKMSFVKQVNKNNAGSFAVTFGQAGLPVGSYSYCYRYVTDDGDRSAWSPITEMIPVVSNLSGSFSEHPNVRTFSKDPNIASPSAYGNHLRLRYNNENNFNFIEVRRDSWYAGNPLPDTPVSEVIGAFSIQDGIQTIDVFDIVGSEEAEEAITVEELVDAPEDITKAKAVRYFNSQLYLMNVEYASKDVTDKIEFIDSDATIKPTVQNIGKSGHADTVNATYYKSNMRGEAQGFGVVLFSESGNKSYASEIVESYQMPNRRDVLENDVLDTSYFGVPTSANSNGQVSKTFEVFDHVNAIGRDSGEPMQVNILASKSSGASTGPYATHTPTSQNDTSSTYDKRINPRVQRTNQSGTSVFYNPRGFGLTYYALGAAFSGLDYSSLEGVDGFSVVQTNPAKRVVAQGLGFYNLNEATAGNELTSKERFSLIVNFPFLTQGLNLHIS